ncbi:hypothetical protein FCR2A7T_26780 [Flavobacterium cauense R2A-7]|nr:hypothetical protein FCR2A7T_26780 [Flavobacterium cauense R2A-7]
MWIVCCNWHDVVFFIKVEFSIIKYSFNWDFTKHFSYF